MNIRNNIQYNINIMLTLNNFFIIIIFFINFLFLLSIHIGRLFYLIF